MERRSKGRPPQWHSGQRKNHQWNAGSNQHWKPETLTESEMREVQLANLSKRKWQPQTEEFFKATEELCPMVSKWGVQPANRSKQEVFHVTRPDGSSADLPLKCRREWVTRPEGSSVEEIFFIGSRVICRNHDDENWRSGRVTSLEGPPPEIKVLAAGFGTPRKWTHVCNALQERCDVPGI